MFAHVHHALLAFCLGALVAHAVAGCSAGQGVNYYTQQCENCLAGFFCDPDSLSLTGFSPASTNVTSVVGGGGFANIDGVGTGVTLNYVSGTAMPHDEDVIYLFQYNQGFIRRVQISTQTATTPLGSGNAGASIDGVGTYASFNQVSL